MQQIIVTTKIVIFDTQSEIVGEEQIPATIYQLNVVQNYSTYVVSFVKKNFKDVCKANKKVSTHTMPEIFGKMSKKHFQKGS